MTSPALLAGFLNPSEAAQKCFRAVLGALSEPGTAHALETPQETPEGCATGTSSVGLSLLDTSTPFHVHGLNGLGAYLRFHTGAPEAKAEDAQWAFTSAGNGSLLDLAACLSAGSLEYPERAATLVIQLEADPTRDDAVVLQGPGIKGRRRLGKLGLSDAFWAWRQAARAHYPLGIDLLFVQGHQVWALPRSTLVHLEAPCTSR